MSSVGVIANPWAGKDIRRLSAAVGHTSDPAKIGVVRRVVLGALESGVTAVHVARDTGRIAERAVSDLDGVQLVDGPATGSALDTRRAAAQLAELGCGAVVVLGGDGTARDAVLGWRDMPLVALSTGTNNVFPVFVDGTSAGLAAGLVAIGAVDLDAASARAKVLDIEITGPDRAGPDRDLALVDVAFVERATTGARAVLSADRIRQVIAAIAEPASTGLSTIAARCSPLARRDPGAVVVEVGPGGRIVRVPIVPGSFDDVGVVGVTRLADGDHVEWRGPGVLALDGERDRVLDATDTARVTVAADGPRVIDVTATLTLAAAGGCFGGRPCDTGDRSSDPDAEALHGS